METVGMILQAEPASCIECEVLSQLVLVELILKHFSVLVLPSVSLQESSAFQVPDEEQELGHQ
jgi:hypothetical protein